MTVKRGECLFCTQSGTAGEKYVKIDQISIISYLAKA